MKTMLELYEEEAGSLLAVKICKAELATAKRYHRNVCRTIYEAKQLRLFGNEEVKKLTSI